MISNAKYNHLMSLILGEGPGGVLHLHQDTRIELWNLFREDVRDVFECTRANMDNYMVVGTLIVASVTWWMVDAPSQLGTKQGQGLSQLPYRVHNHGQNPSKTSK